MTEKEESAAKILAEEEIWRRSCCSYCCSIRLEIQHIARRFQHFWLEGSPINPFYTRNDIGTPFDQVLTLNVRKSVESWILAPLIGAPPCGRHISFLRAILLLPSAKCFSSLWRSLLLLIGALPAPEQWASESPIQIVPPPAAIPCTSVCR